MYPPVPQSVAPSQVQWVIKMAACDRSYAFKNTQSFEATHYVSVKHNHISLFKYGCMFQSVKTISPPLHYF